MPSSRKEYQHHEETEVEKILRRIGLEGVPRDEIIMRDLESAIEHPAQVAGSPFLADEDPLKLSAMEILDRFEAVTNGMDNPEMASPPESDVDPFRPWRRLIDAISAFYKEDIPGMRRAARSIPAGTAPARLKGLFEELAGKPRLADGEHDLFEKILVKNKVLVDGIGVMEEAAAYPSLLRRETARCLPEIVKESRESAQRTALWVLETLAQDDVLSDEDVYAAGALGPSEASRLCALASLPYDPDRALIAWLKSLNLRLLEGGTTPAESLARLSIAAEILRFADSEGRSGQELVSAADAVLEASFPMLKSLLPTLIDRGESPMGLEEWFVSASRSPNGAATSGRRPRRRRNKASVTGEPTLFDEVSP